MLMDHRLKSTQKLLLFLSVIMEYMSGEIPGSAQRPRSALGNMSFTLLVATKFFMYFYLYPGVHNLLANQRWILHTCYEIYDWYLTSIVKQKSETVISRKFEK